MEALSHISSPLAAIGSTAQKVREPSHRDRFTDVLRTSMEQRNDIGQSQQKDLRAAADQLVSMAFLKPLLAQARQSPFQNELFHGGQGEKVFQEHLDTLIADRMAQRMKSSISDAVYKKFAGRSSLDGNQPLRIQG